ncbi:hypothetical protein niasHS_002576 [Heterodera schachtii]|uniref:Uncharacterized protein n=1 Tax=Heterodera schachtii TaxID=97005 RepID=A0ABD2KL96_HETSC
MDDRSDAFIRPTAEAQRRKIAAPMPSAVMGCRHVNGQLNLANYCDDFWPLNLFRSIAFEVSIAGKRKGRDSCPRKIKMENQNTVKKGEEEAEEEAVEKEREKEEEEKEREEKGEKEREKEEEEKEREEKGEKEREKEEEEKEREEKGEKEREKEEEEKGEKEEKEEQMEKEIEQEEDEKGKEHSEKLEEMKREEGPSKGVRFMERTETEGTQEMERLEEYERKLRRNTKEALELVDRLCELQRGQTAPSERLRTPPSKSNKEADTIGEVRKALANGVRQMGEEAANWAEKANGERTEIGEGCHFDVESVSLNGHLLHSPCDCVLLPGHSLLLVDSMLGLSLLSLKSRQLIRNICPPANGQWRNAKCACLAESKERGQSVVYVMLEHRRTTRREWGHDDEREGAKTNGRPMDDGKNGTKRNAKETKRTNQAEQQNGAGGEGTTDMEYEQVIARFTLPDLEMTDRIEAPKNDLTYHLTGFWWLREHVVTECRLCFVPQTECLFLTANTPNQGFLYELNIRQGKWTECAGTKRFRNYSDLHPFAVIGPVTELLLVETNRCYVQLVSLYGSNVVHERMIGLCERPGSLCVDERGNLFVFDRANSKVGLYSRTYFEKIGDVTLVERANCRLSAREGVLAVMCGTSRELKLHRYSEEQCRKELNMPMP